MFAQFAAILALATTALAQNSFSINTPAALVQCQPASISWVGGASPFILATIPGGQTGAAAISTLSTSLTASPYTWTVDLAAGTYITFRLTASNGDIAYSSPITIQAGSSNACLNASAATSGIATTGAVTTTGSGSSVLVGTASVASSAAPSSASSASVARSSSAAAVASSSSAAASSAAPSSMSTPVSSAPSSATSAPAAASSSGAALPGFVAGVPAVAAGVLGGLAFLF